MKRLLATAALVGLLASPAAAQGIRFNYEQHHVWTSTWPNARVIHVYPPLGDAERAEIQAETTKWEAFCQPTIDHDSLGVGYYRYAHEGCEFGRSQ